MDNNKGTTSTGNEIYEDLDEWLDSLPDPDEFFAVDDDADTRAEDDENAS